jgi:hypothetical protein
MPQFRAKARAVEMLGKGQIADLSTAILELWKNGYDAYADRLEAFLFLSGHRDVQHPFVVIADDGKGMSRKDILEKWIVLGTDSKYRNDLDEKGEETLWKEPRVKMGEKGIGRLSVAYLGSPMLMLTRKKNEPLQAVFFHWSILENFNLYLEDVNIPMKSVDTPREFEEVFDSLRKELLENLATSRVGNDDPWKEQSKERDLIKSEIEQVKFPSFFGEQILLKFL